MSDAQTIASLSFRKLFDYIAGALASRPAPPQRLPGAKRLKIQSVTLSCRCRHLTTLIGSDRLTEGGDLPIQEALLALNA
ncbi:MAG: hypothetical protein WDN46_21365 [Methylocella sp.]